MSFAEKLEKNYNRFMGKALNLLHSDAGAIPIQAIFATVVAAAIGLGVVAIVMVLMPSVAGDVITSINVTADNPFYSTVQSIPTKINSSYVLLGLVAFVAVIVLLISILYTIFGQ